MKAAQFFVSTLKEAPNDAEIVSHQLMVRAGMIRKVGSGIYSYMPMGLRVLKKIEAIVREEMDMAGAVELLMPMVQPAELWQETGRWSKMGAELLRIKDRHERDFVIQPTSEEVVTDIVRNEIKSYKQLPINFYQIQTKFRDERRPRFGLMRGREFSMKDAYSFDRDLAGLKKSYDTMFAAYTRIFTRLSLSVRAVAADNGAIGGSGSQEFHVIAETGEDAIAYCTQSDYAANVEAARALPLLAKRAAPAQALVLTATPGQSKCEQVADFLGIALDQTLKSIVLAVDQDAGPAQIILLMLRGDHSLNELKAAKLEGLSNFRMASEAEIVATFQCPPGYLGPVALPGIRVIADETVALMNDFVCGANQIDYHYTGVNWGRDLPEPEVADLRNVVAGDPSPDGKGVLSLCRGIEVGHVFMLGTRYSESMQARYLDEQGKAQLMVMGCYGIGVSRLLGAAIEQNHDERGIIWPIAIAPFEWVICPIGYDRSPTVKTHAETIYNALRALGVDVILDNRNERPGAMFADWELIGIPHRLVISERGLTNDTVEYQGRRDTASRTLPLPDVLKAINEIRSAALG
ncbi:MAG: proline--tRNA ligase [Ottowia sp.]|nr:proline--tRNA ligase [Ottowia sp.]